MANGKSEDFELDDAFIDDDGADFEGDDVTKGNSVKNSLLKRRIIDDILDERRLERKLKDYDFDLEDDE